MQKRLNEEEARNRLMIFIDQSRPDKPVVGFGIELGPGLPERTRLVFYRFGAESNPDVILLLADDNPSVFVQRISFDDFISNFLRLGLLVRKRYLHDWPEDHELTFRFVENNLAEQCRSRDLSIYEMVDMVNEQVGKRFVKLPRFIEEIFSPLIAGSV